MSDEEALATTAFAAGAATATASQAADEAAESEQRSEVALDVAESAHQRADGAEQLAAEAIDTAQYTRSEMDARFADNDARMADILTAVQGLASAVSKPAAPSQEDDRAPAPKPKSEDKPPAGSDHQGDSTAGDEGGKKKKKTRSDGFSATFFGSDR